MPLWNIRLYCILLCPNVPVLFVALAQVDEDVALDQAVKFCQIQLATAAQRQVKRPCSKLHINL